MKTTKINLITLLLFSTFISTLAAQEITGVWITANNEAKIEIYQKDDGLYEGKMIWTQDTCEVARHFCGSIILSDLKKDKSNVYKGKVCDVYKNKIYNSIITLKNENEMNLRGYVGISLFGRTESWIRDLQ